MSVKRIHIQGCKEGLSVLQKLAKDSCKNVCLDKIQRNRIALALDEVFANIHAHGYGDLGGEIDCSARWLDSQKDECKLEICLRDYAPTIDMKQCQGVCSDTLNDYPVAGGLGMYLIEATTEIFEHKPLADGNHWRLVFKLETEKGRVK